MIRDIIHLQPPYTVTSKMEMAKRVAVNHLLEKPTSQDTLS